MTLYSLAIWVCVLVVLISSAMMLIRGMFFVWVFCVVFCMIFRGIFRGMVMLCSLHAVFTSPTDTPYFLAIFCMLPSLSFTSWAIWVRRLVRCMCDSAMFLCFLGAGFVGYLSGLYFRALVTSSCILSTTSITLLGTSLQSWILSMFRLIHWRVV